MIEFVPVGTHSAFRNSCQKILTRIAITPATAIHRNFSTNEGPAFMLAESPMIVLMSLLGVRNSSDMERAAAVAKSSGTLAAIRTS